MTAGKYNLTIEQGATFAKTLTFPSDYTMPTSCRMTARTAVDATSTLFNFDSTTTSGNLTINNTNKTVTVFIDHAVTAAYTFSSGVYDLEFVYPSSVVRILEGTVTLTKEVTR